MKHRRSFWISIYLHPEDNLITLEIGKINASAMMYRFNEKTKKFIAIGYPRLFEYVRLPKLMTEDQAQEWIWARDDIRQKCEKHAQTIKPKILAS